MTEPVTPLFLVSMPRSGSTLLQRMLGAHRAISTAPEPTFLLPLLHLDRDSDVVATYDQRYTALAVQDFVASLSGGADRYRAAVADFATSLYQAASDDGATYFLDKTPKYHLVIDDIAELFPSSPIIILWRNPLAIISSLVTTWGKEPGRWNIGDFRIDLYEGLPKMIDAADRLGDRVVEVTYEALVADPRTETARLVEALDLDPDPAVVDGFSDVRLEGRIQDPNAAKAEFQSVRADRNDAWLSVLANPVRRRWCLRYLDWLGSDRLARMGYSHGELRQALEQVPATRKHLATDLVDIPLDQAVRVLELRLLQKKARDLRAGRRLLPHK